MIQICSNFSLRQQRGKSKSKQVLTHTYHDIFLRNKIVFKNIGFIQIQMHFRCTLDTDAMGLMLVLIHLEQRTQYDRSSIKRNLLWTVLLGLFNGWLLLMGCNIPVIRRMLVNIHSFHQISAGISDVGVSSIASLIVPQSRKIAAIRISTGTCTAISLISSSTIIVGKPVLLNHNIRHLHSLHTIWLEMGAHFGKHCLLFNIFQFSSIC